MIVQIIKYWCGLPWMKNNGLPALMVWAVFMAFLIAANVFAARHWGPLPFSIIKPFLIISFIMVCISIPVGILDNSDHSKYPYNWRVLASLLWMGTKFALLWIVLAALLTGAPFGRSMALSWGIFIVVWGIWGSVLWIQKGVSGRLRTDIRHSHIQEAIRTGNVSELQNLLQKKTIDFSHTCIWKTTAGETLDATPAGFAAYYAEGGQDNFLTAVEMVKAFKTAGADLDESLFWTSEKGYLQALQALLAGGADKGVGLSAVLGHKDELSEKRREIANQLLREGCDVNHVNKKGNSPLMRAVSLRDTDLAKQLLAAGADVNAANKNGETALMYAILSKGTDLVISLLAAGADVNAVNQWGDTPLLLAADPVMGKIVKVLVAAGANVNIANPWGMTALMFAISEQRTDIVKLLLEAGANADAVNIKGKTSLMFAAQEGDIESVKVLLAARANVNAVDKEGKTALMYASKGNSEIVDMLRAAGAKK